jgi:hypothetical protein
MTNEIARIGDLNYLFIVILNELRVKCVIGSSKFVRIFKGPMGMVDMDHYYFLIFVE